MGQKLFIGGLPYSTTDEALRAAFEKAGAVEEATIITDRFSGRSKGFGFVVMATEEEAKAAIEMYNGTEFEGRKILVDFAKPKEDRPPRRDGGGGYRGNRDSGRDENSW